uniref:ZM domain-containing protein n=1 Tax=Caenorhabditis tropicalis TaxID=1561998 RepID=A0A1I7UXM0_9PELO
MIMAHQQKNAEQNEQITRQSRSPSVDSVSRLHQQSGGFATHNQQPNQQNSQQPEQRRGSFSKDGNSGYYQQYPNNGGYKKQSYNQRSHRSSNQRNSNYQQNGEFTGNHYQQGYQPKQQRNYQNYPQHHSKFSTYFHQSRPIFNSTQEFGAYSVRRQSPASPSSPTPSAGNSSSNRPSIPPPILLRHVDPLHNEKTFRGSESELEPHHDAKIHQYRSAGTAPGGFSNSSSPYKQSPPQPPTTPSSSEKRGDSDDWNPKFQQPPPPPGLQNHYRRGQHENVPPPIELQRKNAVPSLPIDINPKSQPTTPASFDRTTQLRVPSKETHSIDSVDAKHPCFTDDRLHSALQGDWV